MGHTARRPVDRLVAYDDRGRVLGTSYPNPVTGTITTYCNDCERNHTSSAPLSTIALDWLRSHTCDDPDTQPSSTVERDIVHDDPRPSELAMRLTDDERDELYEVGYGVNIGNEVETDEHPHGGLPLYHVVCPDDEIRHELPFITITDATRFADRGHACLSLREHRLTRWQGNTIEIRPMVLDAPWAPLDDVLQVVTIAETVK